MTTSMQHENAIQLTTTDPLQFKERTHTVADDTENSSIAFRILNKHHRVRLSSNEIDYSKLPGKTNLFAVANQKGCFVTIVSQQDGFYVICSPLKELRDSVESGRPSVPPFIPFQSRSSIKLPGIPCNLAIASNDERVLVGMLDGSVLIYDLNKINESQSDPIFIIPARSSGPVGTILSNRGENPELVAILHSPSNVQEGYRIEVFNVNACNSLVTWCRGEDVDLIPISISWSPKGKQIAIGLQSGGILLYNPHDPAVPKNYIPKSPSVPNDASALLSITWIATNTFYLVFSPDEPCFPSFDRSSTSSISKTNVILVYEPKARIGMDITVSDPTPPFGAAFLPGQLCCVIKDWLPSKFLLVCGDGPSTDIGVIASTSDKNWSHYSFEETSTPALPLGEGAEDMALLGLDIDLTNDRPVRISEQPDDDTPDLPPSPIVYAYMSDGSVVAWHLLFLDGTPFPGMVRSAQTVNSSDVAIVVSPQSSEATPFSDNTTQPFSKQQPSLFGSASTASTTGSLASPGFSGGFGKPSTPAFGVSGWGFGNKPSAPTSFGNTSAASATPVFGRTGFSNFASSTPISNNIPSGGGFAAFAQAGASSFGAPLGAAKVSVFDQPSGTSTPAPSGTSGSSTRSTFGFGGQVSPAESSKLAPGFSVKTTDISTSSSGFNSKATDSSFFGTKSGDVVPNKDLVFGNKSFGTIDLKPLDTMSSLGGSLQTATTGSPPASPTMEESPTGSPISETFDPMPSYSKKDTGSPASRTTSTDSKPISTFIKPGSGAFGVSTSTSLFLSPPNESVTGFGSTAPASENKPTSTDFAASKPAQPVSGKDGAAVASKPTSFPDAALVDVTATSTIETVRSNKLPLPAPSSTLVTPPQPPHVPGLGIGLGRPSSRPARSSPLASAPITLEEEEVAPVPTVQEKPAPPKPAASLSPSPSQPGLFSWKPESKNTFKTTETNKAPAFGSDVAAPAPPISNPMTPSAAPGDLFTLKAESMKLSESQDADAHPLQIEFTRTYEELCNELRDLEKRLEALKALFPALQISRGLDQLVKNNEDFVPGKYSFGDLHPFKILLSRLREKVLPLLDEGKADKLRLAELQNLTLISETKREELSRWLKAKENPEFAKTLKPTLLGPEHAESQLRLRKLLQITLTRLQQCEDIMESLQTKLNQEKSGRTVFQAPTLDTIDRTCRNIKMALDERNEIVDKLSQRMEVILPRGRSHPIDVGASFSPPSSAPFANLAVAALNSERSCLSLKDALLRTRQRPLFTDRIIDASPSVQPRISDITSIPSWTSSSFANVNTFVTNAASGSSSSIHSNSHDSTDRRRQSRKHVSIAVPLRNSAGEETKAPAASFDWGPLPTLTSAAPKELPFKFNPA